VHGRGQGVAQPEAWRQVEKIVKELCHGACPDRLDANSAKSLATTISAAARPRMAGG
jgi:hypothetical protein